jgi:molybdenum cofactor biosynthesis enzyme MoaA
MSLELAHVLSQALDGVGIASATITGGEPLLHPHLEQLVGEFAGLALEMTLVTNGCLLTPRVLKRLRESGLSKIRLGVDSVTGDRSRPTPNPTTGLDVSRLLHEIREAGLGLEINCVLTAFNRDTLVSFLEFVMSNNVPTKFFEHVEIDSSAGVECQGVARAVPEVQRREFELALASVAPDMVATESSDFGGANFVYSGQAISIRYCSYLCKYGLCHLTGTRVDPLGQVYVCMAQQRQFRISADSSLEQVREVLRASMLAGCINAQPPAAGD